jgi:hypothetical protein
MDKYLKDLKEAISNIGQSTLFGNPEEKLISACIEYLKYNGYGVVRPLKYTRNNITSVDGLVEHFYSLEEKRVGGSARAYRNSRLRDLATAKRFVESRMKANGVSKAIAIKECATIISTVFDHYNDFKFKFNITFSVFGQDKLGWVTERAVQIINSGLKGKLEDHEEEMREKMLSKQDENCGFDDLDEILKKMEEEET